MVNHNDNINTKLTPATKPLLYKDQDGLINKCDCNYRQAIGMLTYLQGTYRPDISVAVHQAARFTIDPKLSHKRAVHRIARYLKGTKDKRIIFYPKSILISTNYAISCIQRGVQKGGVTSLLPKYGVR